MLRTGPLFIISICYHLMSRTLCIMKLYKHANGYHCPVFEVAALLCSKTFSLKQSISRALMVSKITFKMLTKCKPVQCHWPEFVDSLKKQCEGLPLIHMVVLILNYNEINLYGNTVNCFTDGYFISDPKPVC